MRDAREGTRWLGVIAFLFMTIAVPAVVAAAADGASSIPLPAASPADAGPASGKADKSRYTLCNPTPPALMREFTTDRPDKTESPYTVDAGHVQIELDLFTWAHDRAGGVTADEYAIVPTNFKLGLTSSTDIQLIVEPYRHLRVHTSDDGTDQRDGFGNTIVRLKQNLFGNDGGDVALGLMPFIKFPTSTGGVGNHWIEGGLIVPVNFNLPAGFSLPAMTEVDAIHDEEGSGNHAEWINSAALHHSLLSDRLDGFIEFWSAVSSESHTSWMGTVDFGLQYALTKDLLLDCALNVGVTRSAPDVEVVVGLSLRF